MGEARLTAPPGTMSAVSAAMQPEVVVVGDGGQALAAALAEAGLPARGGAPGDAADVVVVVEDLDVVRAVAATDDVLALVVVAEVDRRVATVVLDLGASGIALIDDPPAALAQAVRAVAAGFLVVPQSVRQALRRPVLTTRQKQILSLVVLGLSNNDIAQRLYLTEATVKSHLTTIFAKLGVRSRKEAVDLILDPTSGLGAGVLGIPDASRVQSGYGAPRVG
jgi:DNA-binding NarL/FixJ family response regulator